MLKHYGAVVGVVGGVTLLQFANTLLSVVLPLQLALAGYSGTTAGLVISGYGAGFLIGCLVTPRLIRDVGHIRAFAVLAALCSVTSMVFAASQLVLLWFVLRLLMGFCQAGLFTVVEGWLSAAAPAKARGGVLSFYLVSTKVAIVGGQLFIGQLGAMSSNWFLVAGAVFTLSLIPIALTHTPQPPSPRLQLLGPRDLYRVAPAAVVGCLASGLLNSALLGLTPIYGTRLGLAPAFVVWLLTAFQLGSFVCQWPLGRLSDRVDRRMVIAGCVLAVAALSVVAALAGGRQDWLVSVYFLLGASTLTFYAVAVAHAADFAEPDQMVGVSSSLLLAWAAGAAAGPTLAAPFIDLLGPPGLFLYSLLIAVGLAAFVLWRMTRRAAPATDAKEGFVNLPASTPRLAQLDPRMPEQPAA
ncbi:MAG: MFS transporter [Geminicoccaceae bacterium]|jgi:MFS family permease